MPLLSAIEEGNSPPTNIRSSLLEDEAIAVQSDTFVERAIIDNREYLQSIYQFYNSGANGLDYEIYGHVDVNAGSPPSFDNSWKEIKALTTLATDDTEVETLTNRYAWIQINMKRTVAGQDTTCKILWHGAIVFLMWL